MALLRDTLERWQALIYLLAMALAASWGLWGQGGKGAAAAINPALALMLYVTFLQVPMSALRGVWRQGRFVVALLVTNFVAIPLLVWGLSGLMPADPLLRFGVLLVLLAPCIDYVVTFAHMGKADARLLLACTPLLLMVQMLLLPVYLYGFLGQEAAALVRAQPFIDAFVGLMVVPLLLAALTQWCAARWAPAQRMSQMLGMLPVPATAAVLFVVVAAVVPQLQAARSAVWQVLPVYGLFAVLAPLVAWRVAKTFRLAVPAARAIAFSGSTRNALVVLPLALAVPGAMPVLPAVVVAQTLVELLSQVVYVQRIAKWQ